MNKLFKELIDQHVVVVYIDDILIFTATLEEHRRVVCLVLEILAVKNLFLKLEKCVFGALKVEFVGLVISEGQVAMDPVKVEGVKEWSVPEQLVDVQSFLGFNNFYHWFIEGFAHIFHPLHALAKKDQDWRWTQEHQDVFQALKDKVTSTPIPVQPHLDRSYSLETDSSGYATSAILFQLGTGDKWHPVGCYSKGLSEVERN